MSGSKFANIATLWVVDAGSCVAEADIDADKEVSASVVEDMAVGAYWVPLVEVAPVRKNRSKSPTLTNKCARGVLLNINQSLFVFLVLLLSTLLLASFELILFMENRPPTRLRQLRKLNDVAL